ncbi:MAG: hypothetical protein P8Y36_10150 [Alphaproteobacteria bacterium]
MAANSFFIYLLQSGLILAGLAIPPTLFFLREDILVPAPPIQSSRLFDEGKGNSVRKQTQLFDLKGAVH